MKNDWKDGIMFFEGQTLEPNYYDVVDGVEIHYNRMNNKWTYRRLPSGKYSSFPPRNFNFKKALDKLTETLNIIAFHLHENEELHDDITNQIWLEQFNTRYGKENIDKTRQAMLKWEKELENALRKALKPILRMVKDNSNG